MKRILTMSAFALLGSCASRLGTMDIDNAPKEFEQKIEKFEPAPAPSNPAIAAAPQTESLSKLLKKPAKPVKAVKAPKKKAPGKGAAVAALTAPAPEPTWSPRTWPFNVGEKITLVLRYGPLEGGIAVLEVLEPKRIDGVPVLHYRGHVKSSKVLELFYKVDSVIESWVGLEDHLPRRQEIKQRESSKWGRRVVVFDQQKDVAKFYANTTMKDGRVEEINREDGMAANAQDVFGALYFYRFAPELDKLNFPIHDRFRNWGNEMTFVGKEKIIVPAGEFDTLRFKMLPRVSGSLEPKGDVEIWFKDDPSRVIVQFKAHIKVGSVTGELKSYEPGTNTNLPLPVMRTPTTLTPGG